MQNSYICDLKILLLINAFSVWAVSYFIPKIVVLLRVYTEIHAESEDFISI